MPNEFDERQFAAVLEVVFDALPGRIDLGAVFAIVTFRLDAADLSEAFLADFMQPCLEGQHFSLRTFNDQPVDVALTSAGTILEADVEGLGDQL